MVKYYCDVCEKELINPKEFTDYFIWLSNNKFVGMVHKIGLICDDCLNAVHKENDIIQDFMDDIRKSYSAKCSAFIAEIIKNRKQQLPKEMCLPDNEQDFSIKELFRFEENEN